VPESPECFDALLARAREGDPAAQAELVRRYEPRVRLVARVLLGRALQPYLDSVDLVQSVHRSLLLGVRGGKFAVSTAEQLIALATTMARRKVARIWRHMRRQRRLESGPGDADNLPDVLLSLHSTEADPARAALLNDAARRLCDGLSPADRRLMELRLQGYTSEEIAAEVGVSKNALMVRMHRLRQRLRDEGMFDDWF
jgi:RNA polymerase sigma-70 factor (ECF subfamily)